MLSPEAFYSCDTKRACTLTTVIEHILLYIRSHKAWIRGSVPQHRKFVHTRQWSFFPH